jgi:hypothetical protein
MIETKAASSRAQTDRSPDYLQIADTLLRNSTELMQSFVLFL